MGFFKSLKKTFSHNKTLSFLADPVKPFEKVVNTGYKDVKSVVSYGGKHIVADVDNVSTSIAGTMPLIIGGAVVVFVMMNRR